MKNPTKLFSRKGFTLIELIVVMGIIAVLAAAGFTVGPALVNKAKKVSSQAGAISIAMAVEQFYTEYSALPDPTGTATEDNDGDRPPGYSTTDANGKELLEILAGIENVVSPQNPRKMRFLTAKEAKNGMDGIEWEYGAGGDSIVGMYDAWGQPFYVILDYDYDERLKFTPKVTPVDPDVPDVPEVELNGRRVAVYSLGVKNAADANANTLVKSW